MRGYILYSFYQKEDFQIMDIIIPLAKDPRHAYAELRYTLRSIDQNLSGHSNIYIIGAKPNWIHNVIHIPFEDLPRQKAYSIFRKMLFAARHEIVSQQFISWADDTYLMEKLHVTEIKAWYHETLKDWIKKSINSRYCEIIKSTMKLFPDGLFFNVHTPCIYEKEKFKEIEQYRFDQTELLTKSTYFNHHKIEGEIMQDPKLQRGLFYSSGGTMKTSEVMMLKKYFPNSSRYETNDKANAQTAFSMVEAKR